MEKGRIGERRTSPDIYSQPGRSQDEAPGLGLRRVILGRPIVPAGGPRLRPMLRNGSRVSPAQPESDRCTAPARLFFVFVFPPSLSPPPISQRKKKKLPGFPQLNPCLRGAKNATTPRGDKARGPSTYDRVRPPPAAASTRSLRVPPRRRRAGVGRSSSFFLPDTYVSSESSLGLVARCPDFFSLSGHREKSLPIFARFLVVGDQIQTLVFSGTFRLNSCKRACYWVIPLANLLAPANLVKCICRNRLKTLGLAV
uniref:Uncharacterized protein n=1 Tax=Oryza brachyantha TaxID=4533 RepID=J3LEK4_ORYBR